MHRAPHHPIRARVALLASSLLLVGLTAIAQAQLPPPTCQITGPTDVQAGQPFLLCGADGPGYTYSWYDPDGNLLNHDRCLDFPSGLAVGEYDYEFVISQGEAFLKCPVHIVVRELPPPPGACWLTGGGGWVDGANGQPVHSYGGNINPGCSPTAGDGGSWNDVWHPANLHFHGQHIEVIRCGNWPGIAPGSESPKTPVNFIEFRGTGTLKGIKGNKADYGTVYFFGHYQDREEPGSHGQPTEAERDRYFLHVFSNPADPNGSTLMLVDVDGNPATMDPVTVTHGNLQMHISGCDFELPPTSAMGIVVDEGGAAPSDLAFAVGPNPTRGETTVRFGLPRDAELSIGVFDVAGRLVADLANGRVSAGSHSLSWDLSDRSGRRAARGLYFVRMSVDGVVHSRTVAVTN